ncbi:MAG: LysM peptidoglycan-binding domain-containing protein [Gemmatimonadota bacterium]
MTNYPPLAPAAGAARRLALAVLGLLLLASCGTNRSPAGLRPDPAPSFGGLLGVELRPVDDGLLGPTTYDLPIVANTWVESELDFLLNERRHVIASWIRSGDYYAEFVREIFRAEGIPTDLYHLGMIESGYTPVARSRAGAVGMWQFMPAASQDMGLRVDDAVDERLDPVRSTRAAARYLRTLHRIHGDWALAVAAYNAGPGRISRSLERFGARDFWDLARRGDLAAETRQYVPRLYAVTIIGRDRERFGFESPAAAAQGFAFDSVHVDRSLPLADLAVIGGFEHDALATLNPHLVRGVTPAGGYWLWVPAGAGSRMQRAYLAFSVGGTGRDRLAQRDGGEVADESDGIDVAGDGIHRVRSGETLWALARQYGVSIVDLQDANGITGSVIVPGQRLRIPAMASDGNRDGEVAIEQSGPIEHVVEAGDTLWGIAERYGSSVEAIERLNGLGVRPILPGQRLAVPR